MEDLEAEAFLADKAYDTNELLDMLKEADITAVIPPVKSRKEQRAYSHELYRVRHVIENVFRALKRWRDARRIGGGPAKSPFYRDIPFGSRLYILSFCRGVYLSAEFFERTRSFSCKVDATLGSTSMTCDSFLHTGFSLFYYAEFPQETRYKS